MSHDVCWQKLQKNVGICQGVFIIEIGHAFSGGEKLCFFSLSLPAAVQYSASPLWNVAHAEKTLLKMCVMNRALISSHLRQAILLWHMLIMTACVVWPMKIRRVPLHQQHLPSKRQQQGSGQCNYGRGFSQQLCRSGERGWLIQPRMSIFSISLL